VLNAEVKNVQFMTLKQATLQIISFVQHWFFSCSYETF